MHLYVTLQHEIVAAHGRRNWLNEKDLLLVLQAFHNPAMDRHSFNKRAILDMLPGKDWVPSHNFTIR